VTRRATELAINDTAVIPLHFHVNAWATRDGIGYAVVDEKTLAQKPSKDVLVGR
jgi:peptide/nickel transport system substrate-binding protein